MIVWLTVFLFLGLISAWILDVIGDAVKTGIGGSGRVAEEALPQRVVDEVNSSAVFDEDVEHFVGRFTGFHCLLARLPASVRFASVTAFYDWFRTDSKLGIPWDSWRFFAVQNDSPLVLLATRSALSNFLAQFKTRGVRKQAELTAFLSVRFDPDNSI